MKLLTYLIAALMLVSGEAYADVVEDAVKLIEEGQGRKAIELLSHPNHSGNSNALFLLGMIYDSGKGVESDQVMAGKYYLSVAKKGHEVAQLYIGIFFAEGVGLEKDKEKAIYWLRKSSLQKNTRAMGMLSSLLFQKEGGIVEAYAWSHVAAKYDPLQANTTARYLIASYCSEEQIKEGEALIQDIERKWLGSGENVNKLKNTQLP